METYAGRVPLMPIGILVASHALTYTMSSTSAPPAKRRKRTALAEDDVDAAEAGTHITVTRITRAGTKKTKRVVVPLVPDVNHKTSTSKAPDLCTSRAPDPQADSQDFGGDDHNADAEGMSPPKTSKVRMLYNNLSLLIRMDFEDTTDLCPAICRSCGRLVTSRPIPRDLASRSAEMHGMFCWKLGYLEVH